MSDYYSSRIDEKTRLINTQGRTFLVYEDGSHEVKIEISNIRMTLLALQDMISSKAREW
jgi:Txe/YoeB family toxin of Txe-Axe toxin-antitoxin module